MNCSSRSLVKPLLVLLCVMASGAIIAGLIGYVGAISGDLHLPEHWRADVPHSRHAGFLAALFAHNAGYFIAFTGGSVLAIRILFRRRYAAVTGELEFAR